MYATSSTLSPTPQSLFLSPHLPPRSFLYWLNFLGFPVRSCCYGGGFSGGSFCDRRRKRIIVTKARVSPYEVLGVSPSATPQDIKRAYRRLALKYHPDVNKEANAQEKFLRIKHAYTTLINSESRLNYGSDRPASGYSGQTNQKGNTQVEEDFYGLEAHSMLHLIEDFFKDLEEEFKNWEASASSSSQGTPKSLWEELAEIGEEFVEFLEKELNINDEDNDGSSKGERFDFNESSSKDTKNSIEVNIDEIEATLTLAQLKKDLGLQ
ncbi:unnamed protein product [Brassica oleracea]